MSIKNLITGIALTTLSASCFTVSATTIPVTEFSNEVIYDEYIGAGAGSRDSTPDVVGKKNHWDIDRMSISREVVGSSTMMTVDIITSFYNDITRSDIVLGDLFMSTNVDVNDAPWKPDSESDRWAVGEGSTDWNYAYTIDADDRDNSMWHDNGNDYNDLTYAQEASGSGQGRLVSGFDDNGLVVSDRSLGHRANQAVYLDANGNYATYNEPSSSDGWTNEGYLETDGVWYGTISFTFDVSNTALQTANQIAFRWAMSCANDIIEGLVTVSGGQSSGDNSTNVSEPQTLLLMLLGMAGIAYRRKKTS